MDKENLIKQLNNKMATAKIRAKAHRNPEQKGVFVHEKTHLNPKYISDKEYFQIAQFYEFLKLNKDLTTDEIRELLNSKLSYSFLRKVDKYVPDMFEELKLHGPMSIAITYVENKYNLSMLDY